jgi:hypothetical protein
MGPLQHKEKQKNSSCTLTKVSFIRLIDALSILLLREKSAGY